MLAVRTVRIVKANNRIAEICTNVLSVCVCVCVCVCVVLRRIQNSFSHKSVMGWLLVA